MSVRVLTRDVRCMGFNKIRQTRVRRKKTPRSRELAPCAVMIGIRGVGHEPSFLTGNGGTLLVPDTAGGIIMAGSHFYNPDVLEGDSLPSLESYVSVMDIGGLLAKVP